MRKLIPVIVCLFTGHEFEKSSDGQNRVCTRCQLEEQRCPICCGNGRLAEKDKCPICLGTGVSQAEEQHSDNYSDVPLGAVKYEMVDISCAYCQGTGIVYKSCPVCGTLGWIREPQP